jgi:transposase
MKKIPVGVGIDYADSGVQVCVGKTQGGAGANQVQDLVLRNKKVANSWEAIAAMVRPDESVQFAVVEACTGAADLADELHGKAGWPVVLAMPGIVKKMKMNPDKSDLQDGQLLFDLGRVNYVPRVWLAPKAVRELRLVVRYRQQWVKQRRAVKQRMGALLREQRVHLPGKRWSKPWRQALSRGKELSEQARWVMGQHTQALLWLEARIATIARHLEQIAREDEMVKELRTYKGIGLVTACVMRAEIGSFTRFGSGKKLARYCALTPRNASSGERQADAGVVQAGNKMLRTVLIEAAHRLGRLDPRFHAMRNALKARGKSGSVVAVAIANRWVRGLHHRGVAIERAA